MPSQNTPSLFWIACPDFGVEEPTSRYRHKSGREFYLTDLAQCAEPFYRQGYLVREAIPSDILLVHNQDGHQLMLRENETLKTLKQDPGNFFQAASELGVERESLMMVVGDIRAGAITYPSRKKAEAAIWQVITSNTWYQYYAADQIGSPDEHAEYQKLQDRLITHQNKAIAERLEHSLLLHENLFSSAGKWMPEIANDLILAPRLVAFRESPSVTTWEAIQNWVVLPSGKTAKEIWEEHISAQEQGTLGQSTRDHPAPGAFFRWMLLEADRAASHYRKQITSR